MSGANATLDSVVYQVQTDFGLMIFDADSTLGYWWTKIINGEDVVSEAITYGSTE